jgi:hypothetical protein
MGFGKHDAFRPWANFILQVLWLCCNYSGPIECLRATFEKTECNECPLDREKNTAISILVRVLIKVFEIVSSAVVQHLCD